MQELSQNSEKFLPAQDMTLLKKVRSRESAVDCAPNISEGCVSERRRLVQPLPIRIRSARARYSQAQVRVHYPHLAPALDPKPIHLNGQRQLSSCGEGGHGFQIASVHADVGDCRPGCHAAAGFAQVSDSWQRYRGLLRLSAAWEFVIPAEAAQLVCFSGNRTGAGAGAAPAP